MPELELNEYNTLIFFDEIQDCVSTETRNKEYVGVVEWLANVGIVNVCYAMASLYKEVKEKYKDNFYDNCYLKIATKLVSINTNAYFPKDAQFKDEFTTRDMYSSPLRRYILDKLENSFQSKEIVNLENLTIEHIMPNTITEEWKKYLNMDNIEEFHEQYKNRIGNLTLTAYNSEMGQKLFDEKKNN